MIDQRRKSIWLIVILFSFMSFVQVVSQEAFTAKDLEKFERDHYEKLLVRLGFSDDEAMKSVDITDTQLERLGDLRNQWHAENLKIAMRENRAINDRRTNKITFEEYRIILKEVESARSESLSRLRDRVAGLLVPSQIKVLKNTSHFQRLVKESGTGDRFGIAILFAKLDGCGDEQLKKIENAVNLARTKYYQKLKDEREVSYKKILSATSPEFLSRFKEEFPEFYDYQSELVKGIKFK